MGERESHAVCKLKLIVHVTIIMDNNARQIFFEVCIYVDGWMVLGLCKNPWEVFGLGHFVRSWCLPNPWEPSWSSTKVCLFRSYMALLLFRSVCWFAYQMGPEILKALKVAWIFLTWGYRWEHFWQTSCVKIGAPLHLCSLIFISFAVRSWSGSKHRLLHWVETNKRCKHKKSFHLARCTWQSLQS